MTYVRTCSRTPREVVEYIETLLGRGIICTPDIQARIVERFGESPKENTLNWWVRKLGIRRNNSHLAYRTAFLEFAADNPGVGSYNLARMFNELHGTDLTGQHVRYWLKRAAA